MTGAANTWVQKLRRIHDEAFATDWRAHLATLNAQFSLTGEREFTTTVQGAPPMWFNGDVESLEPGEWTLVLSLNHQLGKYKQQPTPDEMWELNRNHNTIEPLYTRFFGPLIRIASTALNHEVMNPAEYATKRMVFIECFPYASQVFSLPEDLEMHLLSQDPAYAIERQVEHLLLNEARPGLVLVNGVTAVGYFEREHASRLSGWQQKSYPSASGRRTLRHWEGTLVTDSQTSPVVGFPFLRTMSSHNSNVEIAEFGLAARKLVEAT